MSGAAVSAALVARSEAAIREGSKSFAAAARLFDPRTRESVVMLYAWCRHCDDVIDGQSLGQGRVPGEGTPLERIDLLRARTLSALRGEPCEIPAFAALAEVVRRHAIPERLPLEHLDGFDMDVRGFRYRTLDETLTYCYHVAGVVGVMMAHVMMADAMGARDEGVLDRAADLGLAFQLTNIARDIVEDGRAGRVYVPEDWLAVAGIPPGEIAEPRHRQALAGIAAALVAAAEPYYASAGIGIRALPLRSSWAVATAARVYRAIGTEVVARGPAAWDTRVATSRRRKLGHALAGGFAALGARVAGRRRMPEAREGLWTRPRR